MRRSSIGLGLLVASLLFVSGTAGMARGQDVLVAASDISGPGLPLDVQAKLQATAMFNSVDLIDFTAGPTPTFADISGYDAVLSYSNGGYLDNVAWGDSLGAYVDAGGTVVVMTISCVTDTNEILGLFGTNGYYPWTDMGLGFLIGDGPYLMDTPALIPGHPILDGVTSFDGGTFSARCEGLLPRVGADHVADWNDPTNTLMIAEHAVSAGHVVGLNFFPVSDDGIAGGWDPITDGDLIMANSLLRQECVPVDDSVVAGPGLGILIPDDAYNGSLGSMSCVPLSITDVGDGADTVHIVEVNMGMYHTWIGDLTVKLQSPTGTILTIMSRPGFAEFADDGSSCCGDSSDLVPNFPINFSDLGLYDAELMGTGTVVCQDDNECDFWPNPDTGPGTDFLDFAGESPYGTWNFCVGDSASGDIGAIDYVELLVNRICGAVPTDWYADVDGDGFGDPNDVISSVTQPSGYVADNTDCDDDPTACGANCYPGNTDPDTCDGYDNDCDGLVDEDPEFTWYADVDGDSYGNSAVMVAACLPPSGYVADNTDCDDDPTACGAACYPGNTDPDICDGYDNDCDSSVDEDPEISWYADDDGDTYGDAGDTVLACAAPSGYVADDQDCDDTNPAINPAATELCDYVDNDCDGDIDEGLPTETFHPDVDGDGFGDENDPGVVDCQIPLGYVYDDQDCDDSNAAINPNAAEICDGLDNDCDGTIDVGAIDESNWYADDDGDTYGDPADMVTECFAPSGYVADNTDCDDTDAAINPDATEICNGVDDDCNGAIDDGLTFDDYYPDADGDTYGDISGWPINACAPPSGYVLDHTDCDDGDAAVNPAATEICDGIDNDCANGIDDGLTFLDYYPDADGDTYGDDSVAATSACAPISGYVTDDTDCDDAVAAVNPAATEVCDGVDNDCDGTIDVGAADALTWYEDFDGDGYGDAASTTTACTQPIGFSADDTDCDDTAAAINPGMPEICNGGVDDDCDPATDENVDDDGDGFTECDGDCDDGDMDVHPSAIEVCDGIDNDCNPLTDEDVDDDGDGETECGGDCNDNNDTVYSTAPEICDGLDNDCDGSLGVDEVDADGDGSFLCDVPPDCDDNDNLTYPGAPEQCDGIDNDCDGVIDNDVGLDQDGDGFNACQGDCDDLDPAVYPGAPVELCDGKDTDCDGFIPADEVDLDFDGYLACEECDDNNPALNNDDLDADGASTCDGDCDDTDPNLDIADVDQDGFTTCDGDCNDNDATLNLADDDLDGFSSCTGDCDDEDATVNPDATEVCDNGVDNDCDGVADDVDDDLDGYIDEACGGLDCDDNDGAINPDATEDCFDGVDNDCDGDVDDADDECIGDDDTGDDDTGDDDSDDDDSDDDDTGSDDDDDDTGGSTDCECSADAAHSPVGPVMAMLALLGLAIIRRR